MKKNENIEVVMTKSIVYNNSKRNVELTKAEADELKEDAEIYKLNGWSEERFVENLRWNVREYWKEEAIEIFRNANPTLSVGMGATLVLYTDRRAMTIVNVLTPRKIVVAHNKTQCRNYYAGSYDVLDEIEEYMGTEVFTLRRGGSWIAEGQPKRNGSVKLIVGYRRHYIDPSF